MYSNSACLRKVVRVRFQCLNLQCGSARIGSVVYWSRGQSCERAASSAAVDFVSTKKGLDHRVGHFRPLSIMAYILKRLVLSTVRCFCVVQQQKGVADAMIEAQSEFLLAGQSYAGCRKTCGRGVKRTQILAMGCSTRKPALWQGSPVCRKNGYCWRTPTNDISIRRFLGACSEVTL
jgi:hypothetical protein